MNRRSRFPRANERQGSMYSLARLRASETRRTLLGSKERVYRLRPDHPQPGRASATTNLARSQPRQEWLARDSRLSDLVLLRTVPGQYRSLFPSRLRHCYLRPKRTNSHGAHRRPTEGAGCAQAANRRKRAPEAESRLGRLRFRPELAKHIRQPGQ